jgi:hypothetical protein
VGAFVVATAFGSRQRDSADWVVDATSLVAILVAGEVRFTEIDADGLLAGLTCFFPSAARFFGAGVHSTVLAR